MDTGFFCIILLSTLKKKSGKLEKVQKRATKKIEGLERLTMRDERTPSVWFIKKKMGR